MNRAEEAKRLRNMSNRTAENFAISGGEVEVVSRYGAAIKEHIVAYTGEDNEFGRIFKRGLRSIAKSKLNPKFVEQNVKQQSGFAVEIKTCAMENAENIIGGKSTRISRTDDMELQTTKDGHSVGGVNDQLFDIAKIDKNGFYVEGSARQLKYVGNDPKDCCEKLLSKGYDKYRQAKVPVEIPKDFYDGVQKELSQRIDNTTAQLKRAERSGDNVLAQKHREMLNRLKQTKNNLRRGKLTKQEAIDARLNPVKSTVKDIAKLAHRSGVEGAEIGAAAGGGISLIRNIVALIEGEKNFGKAASGVLKDTAKSAGTGYITSATGSVIKGAMQNSESAALRGISKTAFSAQLGVGAVEVGNTFYCYLKGEIDGTGCLVELGEKGTGMVAATIGAGIGQIAIPIPIVGGMVGSMCGYTLSSIWYSGLVASLQEEKLTQEERLRIEVECQATIEVLQEYQAKMEKLINVHYVNQRQAFQLAFSEMNEAFKIGKIGEIARCADGITKRLGGEPLVRSLDELDERMADNTSFRL